MRVLRTCIDEQVVDELVTKTGLREHTLYCSPDQFSRSFAKDLGRCCEALSTRITGVANINTVGHLVALESYLLSVYYDNIVTAVNVRRVASLVLATEDKSNASGEATERKISCINDDPLFVYSCLVKGDCLVTLCVHCLDL